MEDLGIDELKQLVNFYRQRSYESEFQLLQTQLKLNKVLLKVAEPVAATKVTKNKSE